VFRVHWNIRMMVLFSKEQESTNGSIGSIIIGKLYKRQKFGPVVLLVVIIYLKVLFQSLVHIFSLSITFRVVTWNKVKIYVQSYTWQMKKIWDKLWVIVGDKIKINAVFGKYVKKKVLNLKDNRSFLMKFMKMEFQRYLEI